MVIPDSDYQTTENVTVVFLNALTQLFYKLFLKENGLKNTLNLFGKSIEQTQLEVKVDFCFRFYWFSLQKNE